MDLPRGCLVLMFGLFLSRILSAQQGITYHSNPHAYWYFLTPTGFGPPPKQTFFQNGNLAAWQYQKTVYNGSTTTIGLIPTILLGGDYMPIWVSAHARFPMGGTKRNPASIANLGGFFLSLPKGSESQNSQDFSLFYLNFTFGSREKNFAIGAAIAPTGFGEGIHPKAFTLHGITRLGRRSCLVTENYILYDRGDWIPCTMSGWRGWKGRTAFDLACMVTRIPAGLSESNKSFWIPIPWLALHHTLRFDPFNRGEE